MATYASASTTGKAVTHLATTTAPFNVPPCGSAATTLLGPIPAGSLNDTQAAIDALPLGGGLFGGWQIINVPSGTEYGEAAYALDNFATTGPIYFPAGVTFPDLTQSSPPVSIVVAPNGNVYTSAWLPLTADPVSAVLMHNTVLNEYVLDTATKSQTDWVITMPTKRFYVQTGTGLATRLFQRNFNGTAGSCDDVTLSIYDREERTQTAPLTFSPPPPVNTNALCWEANVLTFNGTVAGVSTLFGSTNSTSIMAPFFGSPQAFFNGWLNLGFPVNIPAPTALANVHKLINGGATTITTIGGGSTSGATVTYIGLPVVGFAAFSYTNGALTVGSTTVLSNYGANFRHRHNTLIQ